MANRILSRVLTLSVCIACSDPPIAAVSCPGTMRAVRGGKMTMGGGWLPLGDTFHVTLSPYCIDEREVTVAEYAACVRRKQCSEPEAYVDSVRTEISCNWSVPNKDDHPINCVGWEQAHAYCAARGKELPTEAQWEMAARGGANGPRRGYPWGDTYPTDGHACWSFYKQRSGTCAVGGFPANALGLRDMAGNVSEWVFDWYADYPSEAVDYHGPATGQLRVARGGSWTIGDAGFMLTRARDDRPADYAGDGMGFRCASKPSG